MAKSKNNINFNNITAETLEALSRYNVAYMKTCDLVARKKAETKTAIQKYESDVKEYKATTLAVLADGSVNPEYSLEKFDKEKAAELARINAWFEAETEPLKEEFKPATKLVNKDIYYAYALTMQRGSGSRGEYVVYDKDGNVKAKYAVKQSFNALIAEFLRNMGCVTDNPKAIEKVAQNLANRCGGMRKANDKTYLKLQGTSEFRTKVVLALLQYVVLERKALIQNDDYTLRRNIPTENTEA